MNRGIRGLWILAGFGVILGAGCGDDRVSGGTSETENVILAVDSLLPDWNRPGNRTTIATVRLDAARINFARTDSQGRDIAVERIDGSPLPFEVVYWDKATETGRLHVRIDTSLAAEGSWLRVRWNQGIARRSSHENTWAGIPDSQKLAINSFLVDDFEDANLRSGLPDSNSWAINVYDSMVVRSTTFPQDAARGGRVMHMACSTMVDGKGYAMFQASLGGQPRNLRSMDSIAFWAKGPAKIAVAFTKNIPDVGEKAWKHVVVDTNWTRISVSPTTFDAVDSIGGNVGWNVVRDSVTHLGFFISNGTQLWLDDIRIFGIERQDLE